MKYRTQTDELGDEISKQNETPGGGETLTRPEFAHDAQINNLLNKFGIDTPVRTGGQPMEIDYTVDLQQAMSALHAAKHATLTIPPELRNKYPNWTAVLSGTETGTYQQDLADLTAHKQAKAKQEAEKTRDEDEIQALRRANRARRRAAAEAEDLKE
jgi:hypothetical protein